jgi:nucleotide-binding universal stress UspA family protein
MTNVERQRLMTRNAECFATCDERRALATPLCGMSTSNEEAASTSASSKTSNQPTESFFEDPLRIRTILVTIDLSEESYRALEFALPLAKHFDAAVHVVHAYEGAHQFSSVATSPVLWSDVEIARRLAEQVQRRSGARPRTEDCHVRTGKPFQEIIATAQELKADLIIIATHGHSGFRHLTLGSTTEKIIRHAPCPVLVVREATRGPIKTAAEGIVLEKILVPVDFSECANEGAKYASVFATRVGADLLLMHVVHPPDYMAVEGTMADPDWPQFVETARLDAEDKLDEIVNFLPLVGISAETQVAVGAPVNVLTEATAQPDVDMVIISTHGYTGLRHALLGSTAEQLVRLAHCPVLVVPSHCRQVPQ